MISMLPLRLGGCRASFLRLFRKFVQSPQSPAFIQKFLNKLTAP